MDMCHPECEDCPHIQLQRHPAPQLIEERVYLSHLNEDGYEACTSCPIHLVDVAEDEIDCVDFMTQH